MRTYLLVGFVLIVAGTVLAEPVISIDSIEELQLIGNDPEYPLDGKYMLTADIDASTTSTWNDGQGFAPIGSITIVWPGIAYPIGFNGHLDGQGHKITNLQIHRTPALTASSHERVFIGLFRAIGPDGLVENLHLENVEITGLRNVGGLAGENKGLIRNCSVSGHAQTTSEDWTGNLGGLVGLNSGTGTIVQSNTAGTLTGTLYTDSVGGLVGTNLGIIRESQSSSAVTGTHYVGGLAGRFGGDPNFKENLSETLSLALIACHASGPVTGKGSVGGLVGGIVTYSDMAPLLENCSASGAVTGTGDYGFHIGGLIGTGSNGTTLVHCAASGDVTGREEVGGLIGYIESITTVFQCYATGNVTGEGNYCGGLVGHLGSDLVQCFATGNVTTNGEYVGGLVGFAAQGKIQDCYASGQVHGRSLVGGLVGWSEHLSPLVNSYAVGAVSSEINLPNGFSVGGLAAVSLIYENSFWDMETSGQESSGGGQGLNTSAMKQKATFKDAGWDFLFTWGIEEGLSYPCLQWASPSCEGDDTLSVTIQGGAVVRASAGKAHTFRAEVSDAVGSVAYQWYFTGADKAAVPISGANESVYAILGVTDTDAGLYYCEAVDDHFTASSTPVELVVLDALPLSSIWTLLILAALLTLAACRCASWIIEN